jgi:gamma-glutamyltranspeptidase/glutathione hydrolase
MVFAIAEGVPMLRVLFLSLLFSASLQAAEPARPQRAGIATAHPLATAAGHEVLAAGGNAFDAAVAVSAALGVVEPFSSGLGGGGFYLLHRARDGKQVFVDGRERAPAAATRDMYLDAQGAVVRGRSLEGALAAAIPGTPAALVHLAREYGRLPLSRSLAPAIRLARDGYAADARLVALTERNVEKLKRHTEGASPFLVDGRAPRVGERMRNRELAALMERLGKDSGESFYRGADASRLVAGVRARGGIWTAQDLADYRVVERAPLVANHRGVRIVTAPPPSSGGITIVQTLNVLDGWDYQALEPVTRKHLLVEAWRRSYRDRAEYLDDPDHARVPTALLVSPAYAAGLRAGIRLDKATPSANLPDAVPLAEGESTTHFSILDAAGNRVAGTQTVNFRYGSGLMPPGTGLVLNNEMDDFSAKPGAPNGFQLVSTTANAIAPGKRPLSSMAPTFVESARGVAILGTPGGSRIPSMVSIGVFAYLAGGDARAMVEALRFHHQYLPDQLQFEPGGLSAAEQDALKALGHGLREGSRRYGNMNAVTWEYRDGKVVAATDPRNETLVDF